MLEALASAPQIEAVAKYNKMVEPRAEPEVIEASPPQEDKPVNGPAASTTVPAPHGVHPPLSLS